jgi:hypothetical protein
MQSNAFKFIVTLYYPLYRNVMYRNVFLGPLSHSGNHTYHIFEL